LSLLSDSEKMELLISILNHHIDKIPYNESFTNYLEAIRFFLKTKDPIIQKAAVSTSNILIENVVYNLSTQFNLKQAVETLIGAFDKVGYIDAIDTAAVILKFEELLVQMSSEEAKNVYVERWKTVKDEPSIGELVENLELQLTELRSELQQDPADEFVQGKMMGVQDALKFARML